ncbi:fatty acid--CoA ligase [Streptomyces chumphonensis]|uniref:Long-chain-fatty-acid--CoA ligase n=1 Tax=Streptomyces chumphonensis TaxID=1214925 RepID=A0A927IER7_9ACTN|nr:long-chain-fatty-acid--CoA ligase [Streptomyces chumphonensis]MBD3934004.1 long-chain-fatty-acid--CoA ligase [Streptomyces chumphonensis]
MTLPTLVESLRTQAGLRPEHPAVRCGPHTLTYAELLAAGNRVARRLRAAGVRPGDRVAYLGKESERYYEILYGCALSGTVLVPLNWRLTAVEVTHILADSGAALVFLESAFEDLLRQVDEAARPPRHVLLGEDRQDAYARWKSADGPADAAAADAAVPGGTAADLVEPTADTPVVQLYTSGTTGLPKGVVLAHRSFAAVRTAMAEAGVDWIDWRPQDVSLVGIPGFHVGGLWWATQNLAGGATIVALPAFTARDAVLALREHGVTTACVVPSMLRLLLAEPQVEQADFSGLRKIVYGGSPITEDLLERSLAVFGAEFAQIYGLTETGNTAVCLPPADHRPGQPRMRAAGRPYPGVRVKIVDEKGAELPVGRVGEVCLATPARMVEYFGLPERTAETLVDGWVHTGDAGHVDEAGYVFIQDRIKDTIIVAGENVYPAEIEDALEKHPGVADAVVVGAPDEHWGERVHACWVPAPGTPPTRRELHRFLSERLAAFKLPAAYEEIAHVPRNPSGKILRRELRDRLWAGRDRKVN